MPESVTDRPTKAHEYIFLLSKSAKYFYDCDAVREKHDATRAEKFKNPARQREGFNIQRSGGDGMGYNANGRNRRTVWTVSTIPYAGAHFATFPPSLIKPCIMAGTSEKGKCPKCGSAWERQTEKPESIVWSPTCNCGTEHPIPQKEIDADPTLLDDFEIEPHRPVPCVVLDPFMGSGTTGMVAQDIGRKWIGFELNEDYAELIKKRTAQQGLFGAK